jgi:hypothetical protein
MTFLLLNKIFFNYINLSHVNKVSSVSDLKLSSSLCVYVDKLEAYVRSINSATK